MRKWVLFLMTLLVLTACASPGGARRVGVTEITPEEGYSYEQFLITGSGYGHGWHLIWPSDDQFAYCVDPENTEAIDVLFAARRDRVPVLMFYVDGGATSTIGCTPGTVETYKLLVKDIVRTSDLTVEQINAKLDALEGELGVDDVYEDVDTYTEQEYYRDIYGTPTQ